MHETYAYGYWSLVVMNSLIFIIFLFSFSKPRSSRDWRSLGAMSAFIVALFTEMYGFPLTVYLLSGWLSQWFPGLDLFSHKTGHLWDTLLGWKWDPHLNPIHILSNLLLFGGFVVLAASWRVLLRAQKEGQLAMTGPYAHVRHPQYAAFLLILVAFLLQWPTLLTVAMFPILVFMYVRLAKKEEQEVEAALGEEYRQYRQAVPGFIPRFKRQRNPLVDSGGPGGERGKV